MFQARKVVLKELQQDKNYEIVVLPFNSQGEGPASPPSTVYVGEAVPTGEPRGLEGEAVSSTEVRLRWKPPQQHMQNGELLGYKVSFFKFTTQWLVTIFFCLDLLFGHKLPSRIRRRQETRRRN